MGETTPAAAVHCVIQVESLRAEHRLVAEVANLAVSERCHSCFTCFEMFLAVAPFGGATPCCHDGTSGVNGDAYEA